MACLGISRRATRDIEEIRRFSVERWGERVAEEYLDSIEQALDRLPGLLWGCSPHPKQYFPQGAFGEPGETTG